MKRSVAIDLLRFAGYHGDVASFTRLYIENRVSYASAKKAFAAGAHARQSGMRCGCSDCRGAA